MPASTTAWYDELTRRQGNGDDLVQQYVDRDGHCNVTADQTGLAFDELLAWVHENKRPTPGLLPGSPPPPEKKVGSLRYSLDPGASRSSRDLSGARR